MQNSNQPNQHTQQPDKAKKDDQSKDQGQSSQQQTPKKESAWKGASPEDVTGKQNKGAQSGKIAPSQDTNKAMGNAANRGPQNQGAPNKNQQQQDTPNKSMENRGQANQPSQNKIKDDDDADTMGSGKRQDDN